MMPRDEVTGEDLLSSPAADQRQTNAGVDGRLVYAIGDIHGCYELLRPMFGEVEADSAARSAGRRPVLIFLGDYIGPGTDSRKVLEAVIWLQRHVDFEMRTLLGGHEHRLLSFLDDPTNALEWLEAGGNKVLRSYDVEPPSSREETELVRARDELLDAMPASHHRFLQRLERYVILGDFAFVHAGIRPGVAMHKQSLDDLLWIGDPFLKAEASFRHVVVHGHGRGSTRPEITANRIGIATEPHSSGILAAVRLEDGQLGVIQVTRSGA